MSTNSELADRFREIADLLDLNGERFKPEAYRRAARTIESLTEDVRAISARGELDSLPGVGEAISEKIREYLSTGTIEYLERIRRAAPAGLRDMLRLPGIGPKTARRFWTELGVEGPAELSAAIEAGRLASLKGFGPRKIELVREALRPRSAPGPRIPLRQAARLAGSIVTALRRTAPVERVEVAGSLRRGRESVGDLDLLVTSTEPERVFDAFEAIPDRREIVLRGPTKETLRVGDGTQVDLRVVEPAAFGAAFQYFTGSKDHNVRLRSLARDRGLKINEYGVFRGDERIGGATEEEVYATLGLAYIPPEIREDQGEIAAAAAGSLPRLVEATDLRGDLHVHADASTSDAALDALVGRARQRQWSYLGIVLPRGDAEEAERWRSRSGDGLTVFVGEERGAEDAAHAIVGDYWLLRAGPTGPPGATAHPLAVVHLATGTEGALSDPAVAAPWLAWAVGVGAAVEVTESGAGDGLDALWVRQCLAQGGRVHVSTVGDELAETLALRTARRGGAGPDHVLNASPEPLPAARRRTGRAVRR